jgi:two-component system, OmpR family, response regulator
VKSILIVDDEDDIRALYESELTGEGFKTHSVGSAEEALQFVENNPEIDLVILDIKLGQMDGLKVLEELRNKRTTMPVILNSAYSTYKSNFNSWLADAYLVKSSNLSELKNQVKELLAF